MSMYENVGLTSLDYIEEILHLRKALADVSDECSKAYDKIANFEQQRWVSVKDRLPEKSGNYLTCNKNDDYVVWRFDKENEEFGCADYEYEVEVTHWMSLPEPPKE